MKGEAAKNPKNNSILSYGIYRRNAADAASDGNNKFSNFKSQLDLHKYDKFEFGQIINPKAPCFSCKMSCASNSFRAATNFWNLTSRPEKITQRKNSAWYL